MIILLKLELGYLYESNIIHFFYQIKLMKKTRTIVLMLFLLLSIRLEAQKIHKPIDELKHLEINKII